MAGTYTKRKQEAKRAAARAAAPPAQLTFTVGTMTLETIERYLIEATLDHVDGDKTKAAELLGITGRTIYRREEEWKTADPLPPLVAPPPVFVAPPMPLAPKAPKPRPEPPRPEPMELLRPLPEPEKTPIVSEPDPAPAPVIVAKPKPRPPQKKAPAPEPPKRAPLYEPIKPWRDRR